MKRSQALGTAFGLWVLARFVVTGAAAHTGHASHGFSPAIPAGIFLASLLVVGAGIYLDRRPDVADRWADLGVGIGVLGFVVAIGLLLV